jgi:hypothetical protein
MPRKVHGFLTDAWFAERMTTNLPQNCLPFPWVLQLAHSGTSVVVRTVIDL